MDDPIMRQEFEQYVKRMETEHMHIHDKLSKIEGQLLDVHDLASSVDKMAINMTHMLEEIKAQRELLEKQDKRIVSIESKDGESWRKFVGYLGSALIGGLTAYLLRQMGLI